MKSEKIKFLIRSWEKKNRPDMIQKIIEFYSKKYGWEFQSTPTVDSFCWNLDNTKRR